MLQNTKVARFLWFQRCKETKLHSWKFEKNLQFLSFKEVMDHLCKDAKLYCCKVINCQNWKVSKLQSSKIAMSQVEKCQNCKVPSYKSLKYIENQLYSFQICHFLVLHLSESYKSQNNSQLYRFYNLSFFEFMDFYLTGVFQMDIVGILMMRFFWDTLYKF